MRRDGECTTEWSRERVEQLAPDAASAKAALALAKPAQSLSRRQHVIWGECQGSRAKPYQVRAALQDIGYRCTCPSRKQPCKHTLGLDSRALGTCDVACNAGAGENPRCGPEPRSRRDGSGPGRLARANAAARGSHGTSLATGGRAPARARRHYQRGLPRFRHEWLRRVCSS